MTHPFDVLIIGARVVDGSGNPYYRADIGISQGRITALAPALFNPNTIADKGTYQDPLQAPDGISYVLVNGAVRGGSGRFHRNRFRSGPAPQLIK